MSSSATWRRKGPDRECDEHSRKRQNRLLMTKKRPESGIPVKRILFITRSNCKHVKAISSSDGLSDHLTVLIDLWLQIKSSPEKANITFRPINKIDLDTLHMDLSNSDLLMHPKTSPLELTDQFSETLSHLLENMHQNKQR